MKCVTVITLITSLLTCCGQIQTGSEVYHHYRSGGEETAQLLIDWKDDSSFSFKIKNQSIACKYETEGFARKRPVPEDGSNIQIENFEIKNHPHFHTIRFYKGKRDSLTLKIQSLDSLQDECLPTKDMEFFSIP
ncbi:MAG: hypothetical protein R3B47_18965 [Bacteroidia bacterium]